MPLQWRNYIWQSLEEGAGKQCSECAFSCQRGQPAAGTAAEDGGLKARDGSALHVQHAPAAASTTGSPRPACCARRCGRRDRLRHGPTSTGPWTEVCRLGKVALTVVMATPDLSSSQCGQGQSDRWRVTIKGRQRAQGKDAVAAGG